MRSLSSFPPPPPELAALTARMAVAIRSWSVGFNGADARDPPPPDFDFGDFLRWGGDFLAAFFLPALLDEPPFLRFVDVDTLNDVGVVTVAVVVVVAVAVVVAAEA
jgi:hypothetical protein